jgi:hypothetical protein
MRGLLFLAILPCCASEPSADDRTSNQIIATRVDPVVDFGSFSTFAVDPVVSTTGDATDGGVAGDDASAIIINQVIANMVARGYRQTDVSSHPDMGINATIFSRIKQQTVVTTGTWWTSPGYGGTPSFWGFPDGTYYAPWTYESLAFKSSTLIIQIVDLRHVKPATVVDQTHPIDAGTLADGGSVPALEVAWTALLHNFVLASGTLLPEVPGAIDQAFRQSPYIEKR